MKRMKNFLCLAVSGVSIFFLVIYVLQNYQKHWDLYIRGWFQ